LGTLAAHEQRAILPPFFALLTKPMTFRPGVQCHARQQHVGGPEQRNPTERQVCPPPLWV